MGYRRLDDVPLSVDAASRCESCSPALGRLGICDYLLRNFVAGRVRGFPGIPASKTLGTRSQHEAQPDRL